MPTTFNLIQTITLSSTNNSILFSSIPQTFTDLYVTGALRGTSSGVTNSWVRFNSASDGTVGRRFVVTQFGVSNINNAANGHIQPMVPSEATAGFYNSFDFYVPNYAGSGIKGMIGSAVRGDYQDVHTINIGSTFKTNSTDAITSLLILDRDGTGFLTGSTVSVYGIKK